MRPSVCINVSRSLSYSTSILPLSFIPFLIPRSIRIALLLSSLPSGRGCLKKILFMNYHRNTRDSRVKNIEVSSHARACIRACWHASPCNAENPCCSQELRLEPVEEEVLESTTKSVNDLQSSIIIHCFYSPSLRPISLPPFRLLPFFSPQWEAPRETPHSKSVVKETAGLKRVKFTSLFRLSHIFAGGAALVVIYPVIQIHSECPGNSFILDRKSVV